MRVVHFQRKPGINHYSIERLFEDVRASIPDDIKIDVCINKYTSKGILKRAYDIFRAWKNQGDINHITGDVHYLTYLLKRYQTVLTIHDCVTLERLKGARYWVFWFLWYWFPVHRCSVVTVISESTKMELEKHLRLDQTRVVVIPDCVSDEFQPCIKEFNSNCPRILQIGTSDNKNLLRVAEALGGLSCVLVIIGKLQESHQHALEMYSIKYENHVDLSRGELIEQYRLSDIVMFASVYEGFGLPILEAQAVGRPVITSNLFSMPEVGGEEAACYVNPYAVSEIRSAANRLIYSKEFRNRLIEKGLQNVKLYSAESIAQQYADLYRSVGAYCNN